MAEYLIKNTTLTAIADAIRERTGSDDGLTLEQMTNTVASMATSNDTLGEYVGGNLSTYYNGTVTSIPSYAFYNVSTLTDVGFTVCNSIGTRAFYSCLNLSNVSFPSCTNIESYAFYGSGLENESFPKCSSIGTYAFGYCKSLITADFPNCASVSTSAFYGCYGLESVSFSKLTSTVSSMFPYCSSLKSVNLPACTTVASSTFRYCTGLTEGIELPVCSMVYPSAFYGCSNLTSVSLPVATQIGSYAFYNCSNLSYVYAPKYSYAGSYTFYGCKNLTSIELPTCNRVSNNAFQNCTGLVSVSLPMCSYFYSYAFRNCTSLTDVYIPKCDPAWYAFYHCTNLISIDLPGSDFLDFDAFQHCINLKYVNAPNASATQGTFLGCQNITSVNVPMTLRITGFRNCSKLVSVSAPLGSQIYGHAFNGCISLSRASFPNCSLISSIYAFYGCTSLSTLILASTSVCTLSNSNTFGYTPIASGTGYVYVPYSLVSSYKIATNWSYYSNQILPIYDVTYPPVTNKSLPLNYTVNVSVPIILTNEDSIPTFTVVSGDESLVSVSNINAYKEYITFDATTFDLDGSTDIYISTTYNGNEFATTLGVTVSDICDIGDISTSCDWMLFNETKSMSASLKYMNSAPEVTITSSNNAIASISNIIVTSEDINFDVVSGATDGNVVITITAIYNGNTFTKAFDFEVYEVSPMPTYTLTNLNYYFTLDDNDYYVNSNQTIENSYALCRIDISATHKCKMYVDYYNNASGDCPGIISKLDTVLTSSITQDSSSAYQVCHKINGDSVIHTTSYDMPEGEHFIYIKFIAGDVGSASVPDEFWFKLRFEYVK